MATLHQLSWGRLGLSWVILGHLGPSWAILGTILEPKTAPRQPRESPFLMAALGPTQWQSAPEVPQCHSSVFFASCAPEPGPARTLPPPRGPCPKKSAFPGGSQAVRQLDDGACGGRWSVILEMVHKLNLCRGVLHRRNAAFSKQVDFFAILSTDEA